MILGLQRHHRHALSGTGGLGSQQRRVEDQTAGLVGIHSQLTVLIQTADTGQGRLVGIGAGELPAVGGSLIRLHLDPGHLAVLIEEQQASGVVRPRQHHEDHIFSRIHFQLGGQVVTQHAGLGVIKLAQPGLVDLAVVGEEHGLSVGSRLKALAEGISLLELLLAVHPQRGRSDLLEIPLPGQEHSDGIFLLLFLLRGVAGDLVGIDDGGTAGLTVFLSGGVQFLHNDLLHPLGAVQQVLQIVDLVPQGIRLPGPLENVFLVDVPQLDLRHIFRLDLVDAEADHQIGDDLGFLLRLPDNADGLVNIQQDALEALQQVQLFLLLAQHEEDPPLHAVGTPRRPFLQNLPDTQHLGAAGDQHVEVAGKGVLQRRQLVEFGHQLVRVHAPLQVDGQLQAGEVGLIPHIRDLFRLARLDQLRHLVQNGLYCGGVGDLVNFQQVLILHIAVLGPHPDAAPTRIVNVPNGICVKNQLTAGGKIRGQQRLRQVAVRVFQIGHRGIADLFQVKAAELGGHAHGDAAVGGYQNIGEGGGQQRRLLHGVVVVIHEVHGVAVDVLEDLTADGGELRLRIPGGGPGHIPGIGLTEVALGVHKRRQQSAVALGETHHRIVDGGVAVGIQTHGLAHDVGGLRPRSRQQTHFIHGVEQLAVGGLEAVDLRDGPGDDDAHGVGHIVGLQRVGDGLLHHRRPEAHDVGVIGWMPGSFRLLLFRHNKRSLFYPQKSGVFAR